MTIQRFLHFNTRYQSILSSISTTNPLRILPDCCKHTNRRDSQGYIRWESVLSTKKSRWCFCIPYNILSKRYYYWLTIFILMKIFVFFLQHYFLIFFSSIFSPYIVHINMHFRYAIYVYIARSFVFDRTSSI